MRCLIDSVKSKSHALNAMHYWRPKEKRVKRREIYPELSSSIYFR